MRLLHHVGHRRLVGDRRAVGDGLPPAGADLGHHRFGRARPPPVAAGRPRSLTTTFAPRAASASACWRPSPPPAPVTIATRPSKEIAHCRLSKTLVCLPRWPGPPVFLRQNWQRATIADHFQKKRFRQRDRHKARRQIGDTFVLSIDGKVAVITGSSRGIGKAIAERMAEHGANVVISSRKAEPCDQVAAAINQPAPAAPSPSRPTSRRRKSCSTWSTKPQLRQDRHLCATPLEPVLRADGRHRGRPVPQDPGEQHHLQPLADQLRRCRR